MKSCVVTKLDVEGTCPSLPLRIEYWLAIQLREYLSSSYGRRGWKGIKERRSNELSCDRSCQSFDVERYRERVELRAVEISVCRYVDEVK